MFGRFSSLLPLSDTPARHSLRTCPVCQTGVADEDRYYAVRGMRIHGGWAGFPPRPLGASARGGRLGGARGGGGGENHPYVGLFSPPPRRRAAGRGLAGP